MKLERFIFILTGWTLNVDRESFYREIKKIKLFLMREYFQISYVKLGLYVVHYSRLILVYIVVTNAYVKMCISRRQRAWVEMKTNKLYSTHQRLNKEHLNDKNIIWFQQWLVGFTDGDGTFSISHQGDKWGLSFKLAQSRYNLRVLYYVKNQLGVGSVTKDNTKGQYFIRDRKVIEMVIFPIFDKYPLLTSKYFDYLKFKKAFSILTDSTATKENKNIKLLKLKNSILPDNYVSPAWRDVTSIDSINKVTNIMSKPWLVGFIEAEGSFYLTNKDSNRVVHGFGLTQKLDEIVLQSIGLILHIPNSVRYREMHNHFILDTTNSRAIENIVDYFKGTMKGMKSLEYRIWSRSYNNNKGDHDKLREIRNTVRKLKKNLQEIY